MIAMIANRIRLGPLVIAPPGASMPLDADELDEGEAIYFLRMSNTATMATKASAKIGNKSEPPMFPKLLELCALETLDSPCPPKTGCSFRYFLRNTSARTTITITAAMPPPIKSFVFEAEAAVCCFAVCVALSAFVCAVKAPRPALSSEFKNPELSVVSLTVLPFF
jgi:hypothetical protein